MTRWRAPARLMLSSSICVAALTPKAEIEGEIGDSHMGLAARMMSQAMRKLAGNLKQSNTLLI